MVAQFAPSTKANAIVGGQTSCKTPELDAFDKYVPQDVDIISCHSLHGPKIDPKNQPLVIVPHRDNHGNSLAKVNEILSCLESEVVYLSKDEHDRITADTQAVTHVAFLSMGKAWHANRQFPWEIARYVGGIENVKINLTLRIYSQKWHVYAGLAILNPHAKQQIEQYAKSVTFLYKLMLGGHREELEKRIKDAGNKVFKGQQWVNGETLLLQDNVLDQFALGKKPEVQTPNNHLSLLSMVHCWAELDIVPYQHLICSTPLFRMWLGVTEYLFLKPGLLDDAIRIAIDDNTFRDDDLEFLLAARGWSDCVRFGDFDAYRDRFDQTRQFFEPRFADATKVGNEMLKTILAKTRGSAK